MGIELVRHIGWSSVSVEQPHASATCMSRASLAMVLKHSVQAPACAQRDLCGHPRLGAAPGKQFEKVISLCEA